MMQWSNLTKCGLFFNIVSSAVHTLLPSVLQRLDSCGIEALILILEKVLNCRYDLIIGSILLPSQVFFHVGEQKIKMVPNQDNMEGDQPVQSHSHAQQPLQPQTCVQAHCPDKTGLPLSVSHYYFSKSWISQCGFIWKETMQLVSRKVEVNAYQVQVSLLWNNSFLVGLWTFQPSLVYTSILDVHY